MFAKFLDIERLIHSTKTVIACLAGFFLSRLIGLPADQWIVITIIVVMCAQIYVGSVIQKAYFRFLGTLAGCLFAAFTLLFVGDTGIAIAFAIGVSSFVFSYFATGRESLAYMGTLGAATTAIIMLGQKPTLIFAFERFFEISIGIMIATFVSQFVLPINARTHLRRAQAATLSQLCDYYTKLMINRKAAGDKIDYHDLDENIVKSLLRQRQLAKESARERLGLAFNIIHFTQTLYCERDILRSISFMHHALRQVKKAELVFLTSPAVHAFNDSIIQDLTILIQVLKSDNPSQTHIHIPALATLKEDLLKNIDQPSREELLHIDGFLFAAETLSTSVIKLADLYRVPIYGATAPV